ncbi:hypothetical protein [Gelidibacter sp.]|uniref:hypothetical protein n=1 Tax=Gelidibacter sp. TaxID=2018083 RepID=UPI002C2D51C9|nr:hypothetical protein [Gelidibacter sp.]HUH28045.1 hypothetical protein [Gelidibacter sp.]
MDYQFNTLDIFAFSSLIIFIVISIILYYKYYRLNEEIIPLRNLMDVDYRRNEVKKLKFDLRKGSVNIEKDFIQKIADLKVEHAESISKLKQEYLDKQSENYQNAFNEGKSSVDFEIRITPLKKIIHDKGFFQNKKTIELGYTHRLYINGIPCLDQNDVIVERFSSKEINDANIKLALENISKMLDKIPDQRAKVIGSFADVGKSIMKESKTK